MEFWIIVSGLLSVGGMCGWANIAWCMHVVLMHVCVLCVLVCVYDSVLCACLCVCIHVCVSVVCSCQCMHVCTCLCVVCVL